jgi:ABC-type siderophore export system fused ATPase/permease subunit
MTLQAAPLATVEDRKADAPAIVLDKVSLAFDEKVILREVSFTLDPGHTKLILGASGSGKSTILKLILGLLKPDAGRIFVNGQRVDTMTERELMTVRADLGMVFQEGALFDSLSVAEGGSPSPAPFARGPEYSSTTKPPPASTRSRRRASTKRWSSCAISKGSARSS